MNQAVLVPLDPNLNQSADGVADRRDQIGRMRAVTGMRPAPLSVSDAEILRDQKMQQVLDHADQLESGWSKVAYLFLVNYCRDHQEFIGHDVVEASRSSIVQPHDTRAWGQIFRRAIRIGCIAQVGFSKAPHRHASPCPKYRSLIWREAA